MIARKAIWAGELETQTKAYQAAKITAGGDVCETCGELLGQILDVDNLWARLPCSEGCSLEFQWHRQEAQSSGM